jgi:pyroglutamyl-peptidase
MRAGFVHLPYLPAQVAQMLDDLAAEARTELHQRADLASMDAGLMRQAVEIAIATTLRSDGV